MGSAFPRMNGVSWQARLLRGHRACGAGLVVDPTHVVTCAHVAEAAMDGPPNGPISLDLPAFPELGRLTARALPEFWAPVQPDGRGDIAVLRLDEPLPDDMPFAPLRRAGAVADREITVFGFPGELDDGVWARARVVGLGGPGREWLQVDPADGVSARIEPGFSGAGAVDSETGSVVGMTVALWESSPVAWIQPVDVLLKYWPGLAELLPHRLPNDPVPPAHGVERNRTGWYFTGRVTALREITAWLANVETGPRGLVVTGDPGAGKSAVLARLATLADPTSRRTTPPHVLRRSPSGTVPAPGSIDVSVYLPGRGVEQVARQIADTLGLLAEGRDEVVSALLARKEPTVLAFDGLDEATRPDLFVRELLIPLLTNPQPNGTRLLIGMRRELLSSLRTGVKILDLDSASYADRQDVVDYVTALLLGAEERVPAGPYAGRPELAAETAAAVARRAGTNFLVAQLSTLDLSSRTEPVQFPGWQNSLPSTVAEAMDGYLARVGQVWHDHDPRTSVPVASRRVTDLLLPLALAEGDGLTDDELWAELAHKLGTDRYEAHDIRSLRTSPAAALLHHNGHGWRLFHQALADYLIDKYTEQHKIAPTGLHHDVVRVLRDRLPEHWEDADAYTRRHFADHAAAAGVLHEFVVDAGYLLAADPLRLIPHLSTVHGQQAEQAAWAYLLAAPNLQADADHQDRVHGLRLAARLAGIGWLADELARRWPHGWDSPWSHWTRLHPHHRIDTRADTACIAFGEIDGEPVVLSCEERHDSRLRGRLRLWDLRTGAARGGPFADVTAMPLGVRFGVADGVPLAITWGLGDETATVVETWDLTTGGRWRAPLVFSRDEVTFHPVGGRPLVAFSQLHGRPVLAVVSESVRQVDLISGESTVLLPDPGPAEVVAFGQWDGEVVVVTAARGTVRAWSPDTGALVGSARLTSPHAPHSLVTGQVRGRPRVFVGDEECLWSVDFESPPRLLAEKVATRHLAFAEVEGRPTLFAGDRQNHITVVRLDEPAIGMLSGHDSFVRDLVIGHRDGRPVAISAGLDRTIRTWALTSETTSRSEPPLGKVRSVALAALPHGPVAVSVGSQDGRLQAWDMGTGSTVAKASRAHNGCRVVSTARPDDGPLALTLARDASCAVWNLQDTTPAGRIVLDPDPAEEQASAGVFGGPGPNMAAGSLFGRPIALVASHRGDVQIWDIRSGQRWKTLHTSHQGGPHDQPAVAYAELSGRPTAILGGSGGIMDVWDLATGVQVGTPMTPGGRVYDLAFAWVGDIPMLACVCRHPSVVALWNPVTGQPLGAPMTGHTAIATAVTVSSVRGRPMVASGGEDRVVRVWDLPSGGCTVLDVGSTVHSLAISEEADIIVGTELGVVCLRPVMLL